jgi:hypothetical protein
VRILSLYTNRCIKQPIMITCSRNFLLHLHENKSASFHSSLRKVAALLVSLCGHWLPFDLQALHKLWHTAFLKQRSFWHSYEVMMPLLRDGGVRKRSKHYSSSLLRRFNVTESSSSTITFLGGISSRFSASSTCTYLGFLLGGGNYTRLD